MLIPKIEKPKNIRQFRPISLCNVAYKTVTKVLVNRLKPLLDCFVAPTQQSFVPGRLIADNVILYKKSSILFEEKEGGQLVT